MRFMSMRHVWKYVSIVACTMCVSACSEGQPCYDEEGNEALCIDLGGDDMGALEDMSMTVDLEEQPDLTAPSDMPVDLNLPQDMGSDAEVCQPLSKEMVCAGVCGSQVDNCDQLVECDACVCDDSAVSQTRCGACNLGVLKCSDPANTNETQCSYPVPDLIDEATCEQILYVDASAPGGNGSAEEPFTSYAAAIARFEAGTPGIIVIAAGTYTEPMVIEDGIHVIGGYERLPDGWRRNEDARIEFKPPLIDPIGPTFGLIARDVSTKTIVHGLYVEAADAPTEQTSYGAYLIDSSGIVLDSMTILAGKGGDGVDGTPGVAGADGEDGGAPFCEYDPLKYGDGEEHPTGGQGGTNSDCPGANGGAGGAGAENNQGGLIDARPGRDSADGRSKGGGAGRSANVSLNAGKDGDNAPPLPMSNPGERGQALGEVRGEFWVVLGQGKVGEDGRHGSGGGGGGGAGSQDGSMWMMGGGGGGSGGCGGTGGAGGTGGGASIGLFAIRSPATLNSSRVVASQGGRGGDGGLGGSGGNFGLGASGIYETCDGGSVGWKSGKGGDGGQGVDGGRGGGGAGGVSIGALCENGALSVSSSAFQAGAISEGGDGGMKGENGVSENQRRCY